MLRKNWLLMISLATMISGCAQQTETTSGMPWWGWVVIILVIFILFWLVFRSRPEEEVKTPHSAAPREDEAVKAAEIPTGVASAPLQPDDLTLIEGIGPKINTILQAAGVNTFAQLAALEPEKIMNILTAAGIRLADPKTWPEQSRMAAAGEMERLRAYQDTLKGGRTA